MRRWTILGLLLFATACCGRAGAPESAAPAAPASDGDEAQGGSDEESETDDGPTDTASDKAPSLPPSTDALGSGGGVNEPEDPAAAAQDKEADAGPGDEAEPEDDRGGKGAREAPKGASPSGQGFGTGDGRLGGDKGAPDTKRKKPASGGPDKKYREDFGVE